eukprot:4482418-Amphidinium_carterae.1
MLVYWPGMSRWQLKRKLNQEMVCLLHDSQLESAARWLIGAFSVQHLFNSHPLRPCMAAWCCT